MQHLPGPSGTTRDGVLQFNKRLAWPITPFVGTLGVQPDRIVATGADGQGPWGGNLDIRDFAPGHQILLPVYHDGGRLYLGDVHASQGDTEFTGTAAETSATVRLTVDRMAGERRSYLRILKPESIVAVHNARPMEVAVQKATVQMMDWLVSDFGFSQSDAYCFVSTCPDFRIHVYQMCDIGNLSFIMAPRSPDDICSWSSLRYDVLDHVLRLDTGQAEFESLPAVGQLFVVEPQAMQNGGLQVVDVDRILHRVKAEFVGRAVGDPRLDAAAGQPHGECLRVMVSAQFAAQGGIRLDHRRTAELPAPNHQRFVKQTRCLRSVTRAALAWSVASQFRRTLPSTSAWASQPSW